MKAIILAVLVAANRQIRAFAAVTTECWSMRKTIIPVRWQHAALEGFLRRSYDGSPDEG